MSKQVLIVADALAARTPAEIVRSLHFTPVVAETADEALSLMDERPFSLIAVEDEATLQRLREAALSKQPMTRVLRLAETGSEVSDVRRLMTRYLDPHPTTDATAFGEDRYAFLSRVLESFTTSLEPKEVVRRIVALVQEEFDADRVWLLHPVTEQSDTTNVVVSVAAPRIDDALDDATIDLTKSRGLVRRAFESAHPVTATGKDRDVDPDLTARAGMRSMILQIVRPREGEPWALGMHQTTPRTWTAEEIALFDEIGRYATLALNNTLLQASAARDLARMSAILDQMPESAAIYDDQGRLERMNAAAARDPSHVFADGADRAHTTDGRPMSFDDLPPVRAARGEVVRSDYLVRDSRTGDDRVINLKAAPIRNDKGRIIGSVVLSRDVTEERQTAERELWRRRRAECLANLGLESVTMQPTFDNLDEAAKRMAEAIAGTAKVYLYSPTAAELHLVGMHSVAPTAEAVVRFRDFLLRAPYHPGEGIPGTVFQIGRPLFFSDVKGTAVVDFARDSEPLERDMIQAMNELTLLAVPIESYGDRIGVLVLGRSDDRRALDAEDLEFAQTVAERIGAAAHIHRLTRISQEGHRAAEELARREVDARVRLEAVLETAPVGVAVISADELRFELVNARFLDFVTRLANLPADTKLIGLRVAEVFPNFEQTVKQVAETGETLFDEAYEVGSGASRMYVNRIISAVRGRFSGITQSITVLIQDVTEQVVEDRQNRERESRRRRHAECLANIGLESVAVDALTESLDEPARRVAQAINGTVRIYLYHSLTGLLDLVGFHSTEEHIQSFREYFIEHPYRPGEGLPGTAFQIGRPLLFFEIRGNAAIDFARDDEERRVKTKMREQSLIACPIESYGEGVGALVVSQSDARRNFDAEDLEFVQSVAERLGAATHIHRLTRISQEGHRAAEELARREVDARVRFEGVLETAPVGIAVVSADELRFELANARWLEFAALYGKISPDTKVIGLRVAEVLPDLENVLKHVADSGETRIDEALLTPGPGSRYVNRIISAVRGRFSGTTQSITILVQDVTDQVRAKREIEELAHLMAERSARLDSILGSMTDGLWVYDANGRVVDVNQAALTIFGLGSRTEATESQFQLRYPDGRAIPPDDLPYSRALRGMVVPDYLAIGRHAITGKDIDLSIAAAPIESNGIVGVVLVIRDITALQELDRKKDEFLSVASHELRTPLTTIKGYTQLLAQTINDLPAEERSTYLTAVLGEIDRMMGLISELLDVSRIETNRLQIHPQPIRWREFIERRVSAFRVQNPGRRIRLQAGEDAIVVADPDRIRQVVDNLLSNAIKYSPEGSDIDVVAVVDEVHIHTSVTDYGIGIPKDEIGQLFERFHRARNVSSRYYGGLGLGLYIAKAIIEAHGGSITVESEEGSGSCFTLRLPLPPPKDA